MRRGSSGRKCGAGYDLALMATAARTTVELERPGGRADVLIVRRITTGRPAPIHGPGARHWTMHYTLTGEREFAMRARAVMAEADTLLVYRREDASGTPPRPSARWDAMSACFETGTAAWVPPAGFERIARDVYRARVPLPATRQRIRAAFARLMEDDQVRIASRTVGTVGAGRLAPAAASEDALRRELMLLTLREILLLAGTGRGDAARLDTRVRDALETMSRDTTGHHTLASLGAEVGLSPSRFGHLFRAELGISAIHALRVLRLRQAALALQYTADSVEKIAEDTGFTSLSHLSREFRRQFGASPRAYRRASSTPGPS